MGVREVTQEQIYDELQDLPEEQLPEVLHFLKSLKRSKVVATLVAEEAAAPLYDIHIAAVKTGIPDLAHQHDHYLYGLDKRDA